MALSKRGEWSRNFPNFLTKWGLKSMQNKYDKETNPKGIVNLGMAENTLCEDILYEKLNSAECTTFSTWMQYYFDNRGILKFRDSLASFMTEKFKATKPLDPDNIVVTSGAGACLDLLVHAFADPGDTFLCLAPYYYATKADLATRGQVKCYDIQLSSQVENPGEEPFQITWDILENGLEEARNAGEYVKGIFLINPNNPTGDVYRKETLKMVLDFANLHHLHVICDEIYGLSVFDEKTEFCSILSFDEIPCPEKTHVVWGFSKDFCLSGFRCGIVYNWNKDFVTSIRHLLLLSAVPGHIQEELRRIIDDKEWLDKVYFPTNLSRLRSSYKHCRERLVEMGIRVHPSKAGFFVWANLSHLLRIPTKEGEIELFKEFMEAGVYCVPGSAQFFTEPGWYRITFSHNFEELELGLRRIQSVVEKIKPQRSNEGKPEVNFRNG